MNGSFLRATSRVVVFLALTLSLMPLQALLFALDARWSRRLPLAYHRLCCRILGVELKVSGEISTTRPTLFVANHLSYLDIPVISAALETSFIAKREVASWPLFGWLAKLQRTVFVDRRTSGVHVERDQIAHHLARGLNLVLFAEGTSGDGLTILPFKSSLFSVAERHVGGRPLVVQPFTLAYTRLDGMPIGRQWRSLVSWYGDMGMVEHAWRLIGLGRITAELRFHPPVTLESFASRKDLAQHCEQTIARGLAEAYAGRGPAPAAASDDAAQGTAPASP